MALALFLNPGADLGASLALAQRGDALGYDSLWVTHGVGRDALLTLSAYAHVAPRAGLGTGVIPIYPRHPVLLAQEALTLAETQDLPRIATDVLTTLASLGAKDPEDVRSVFASHTASQSEFSSSPSLVTRAS